jgi:hypothetical protein
MRYDYIKNSLLDKIKMLLPPNNEAIDNSGPLNLSTILDYQNKFEI